MRECCEVVEYKGDGRQRFAQLILQKSNDFSRRIIAPVRGLGGSSLSYVCPHCHRYPLEDYIWVGLIRARKQAVELVVCGVAGAARIIIISISGSSNIG